MLGSQTNIIPLLENMTMDGGVRWSDLVRIGIISSERTLSLFVFYLLLQLLVEDLLWLTITAVV